MPPEKSPQSPALSGQKVLISNEHGEKLVGLLHQTSSKKLVILCHGFRATKDDSILVDLAAAFTAEGISAFRFDFSGNGESEGEFQYGSYRKEAADLRSVVLYFSEQKYDIIALIGHSKGGNAVLLYASKYHDVPVIVNISGRFALERGIDGRLGRNFMQRINKDGYIDVKNRKGEFEYRVSKASLEDRLSTDTLLSSRAISKDCRWHTHLLQLQPQSHRYLPLRLSLKEKSASMRRVLTIHGAKDEIVPAEDAVQFAANIPNHELRIIAEANHRYTGHEQELTSLVLGFVRPHLRSTSPLRPKL
ncbi:unnamed protein product [Urochloa decumbens]|uniref:Serine aminopeptidase S33 domain-containing protein n=1 Tax=Urochloa decumbens TaxID=240449 RepID=A0ABC8WGU1_9POAL